MALPIRSTSPFLPFIQKQVPAFPLLADITEVSLLHIGHGKDYVIAFAVEKHICTGLAQSQI
jgi:hypothetical protein